MYLVLLAAVVASLGAAFSAVKIKQRASVKEQTFVNFRMASVQEDIKKFEEFEARRAKMTKTALVTSELLEHVPRSVLLALLTNNLPPGVSFLKLNIIQKTGDYLTSNTQHTNKYEMEMAKKAVANEQSPQYMSFTHITIVGIAPSDLQVATYIERLSNTSLLDNIALVESKERIISSRSKSAIIANTTQADSTTEKYRQFKLTASLKPDAYVTNEDITKVRAKL